MRAPEHLGSRNDAAHFAMETLDPFRPDPIPIAPHNFPAHLGRPPPLLRAPLMARSAPVRFLTSLTFLVLLALAGGLALGAWAQTRLVPEGLADAIAGLGQLWLNGLRMTIVPLVFSLLVVGIASVADAARTGRTAGRAVGLMGVLIVGIAVYGAAAAYGLHSLWPVPPDAAGRLMAGAPPAPEGVAAGASFSEFLKGLAPANPIKAAAEDAILGLVVFAVIFGFAATRLPERLRLPLVTFFEAVSETMIVIVRWVLALAPVGVFALAFGVGLTAGLAAAGVLAHYISLVVLAQVGLIALTYVFVVAFGKIGLARFARAAAPAQVVAFSTQSSLACLPVMVERAVDVMGVRRQTAGLVLPLAVAVFRATSPVANLGVVIYGVHLFGLDPSFAQIAAAVMMAVLVSIASVGLPGQVSFFVAIAPICAIMGVPLELLPLLLAVEVIPDIFRTIGNVTADLAVTRVVEGRAGEDIAVSENRETQEV